MPPGDASTEVRRDAEDIDRSLRITLLSYIVKFATPLLLILVINRYGAAAYGVFAVVATLLQVMMRVCLLGLDKGLLWWIPRQRPGDERLGLLPILALAATSSAALALATMAALAPVIARWYGHPEATRSLRWMVASLVVMTVMEVLVQACVARRRIEAHAVYKEGVVGLAQVVLALVFYSVGMADVGLELAYVLAYALGLLGVLHVFHDAFRGTPWISLAVRPRPLLRYSAEIWVTELISVALTSLDTVLLAAFTDARTVGMYRAALQIAQNVLAVRYSFETLVLAVVAEIGVANNVGRLAEGFSRVLTLVLAIQVPLVALLFAVTGWILPLLGPGFSSMTTTTLTLCAVFLVHGSLGLVSCIIRGYGRTWLSAVDAALALLTCLAVGLVLVPSHGALGTALALAAAYALLGTLQLIQARRIVGAWFFTARVARFVALALVAAIAMTATWFALSARVGAPTGALDRTDAVVRLGSFTVFAAILGLGWLPMRGRPAAPGPVQPVPSDS